MDGAALVLFSGGQDSATCLAWALDTFDRVETIGFDYGQRHRIELEVRGPLARDIAALKPAWARTLGQDHLLPIETLGAISDTALTRETAIAFDTAGVPTTFVPGRNLIFLSFAAAVAYRRGLKHLVTGVCETDYSGYADCRDDTMKAMQVALSLGLDRRCVVHTPLMWRDKAATWTLAEALGGPDLVALIRDQSHSCYLGDRTTAHAWGRGCGSCPACDLRRDGYERYVAGIRPAETAR